MLVQISRCDRIMTLAQLRGYDIIKADAEALILTQQGLLDGDGTVGIQHLERLPGGDYTTHRKIINSWKNSDKLSIEKLGFRFLGQYSTARYTTSIGC